MPLRGLVGALALEHAGAVVQAVRQYVDLGVLPGNELSVVPDEVRLFHELLGSLEVFAGLPGWPARWWRRPPGRACAAPRPAHDRRPILPPPPRPPCRIRGAASAPPRGTWPADWPTPVPAMSGAEPCTGSNTPGSVRRPARRSGSIPIEPVSIAASSERMSPNMFSVRITSKWRGAATSRMAALSTSRCSSSMLGNSRACSSLHHLAPQPAGLEHVGLVDAGHPRARGAEGHPRDPLDLLARVDAGVRGRVLGPGLLAEVDPAGQLAHDQQVGALDHLALERAGVIQRRDRLDRAQVGEQAEALAQPEQALLGAGLGRVGGVPFGAADGGQQDRVGGAAGGQRLVGQRGAVGVDRGAAEQRAPRSRSSGRPTARQDLDRRAR